MTGLGDGCDAILFLQIGAVNFNLLHAVLHVIVQQMNIQKCLVEFTGHDSERMEGIMQTSRPGPILKLSEYTVDIDGSKESTRKRGNQAKEGNVSESIEAHIGRGENYSTEKQEETPQKKVEDNQDTCRDEGNEKVDNEPEFVSKKKKMNKEKACPCRKAKAGRKSKPDVAEDVEPNLERAEEGKPTQCSIPHHNTEDQVCQTVVRIETTGGKCSGWRTKPALAHESLVQLEAKVTMLQEAFEELDGMASNQELMERIKVGAAPVNDMWQLYNLHKRMESCEGTMDKVTSMIEDILRESTNVREAMVMLAGAVDAIEGGERSDEADDFSQMSQNSKMKFLKNQLDSVLDQFQALNEATPLGELSAKVSSIAPIQNTLEQLQKDWQEFQSKISNAEVEEMVQSQTALRTDVDNLNVAVAQLLADKQDREHLERLQVEVHMLKLNKADRDAMTDQLATKADAAMVNEKVSHNQLDAAVDDMTKGLEDALAKLMDQESVWNEAMEEVQKLLEDKLDKTEMMPLKEFISKKLTSLQGKLKTLNQMKEEAEAAGAKSRILRNLNCISCDANVVMQMNTSKSGHAPQLTASRSMRPHLTYELDHVRKALKKGSCGGRDLSELVQENLRKTTRLPVAVTDTTNRRFHKLNHLCNRYCGGSHTTTTPQQRVTRIGHFLTEFGPQAVAMLNHQ